MKTCILVDDGYLLPSILTVHDLVKHGLAQEIVLVGNLQGKHPQFFLCMHKLTLLFDVNILFVDVSQIKTPFHEYRQRYHFKDTVLWKLMVPELFDDDFISLIDAGFLVCNASLYKQWLIQLISRFKYSKRAFGCPGHYTGQSIFRSCAQFLLYNKTHWNKSSILERFTKAFYSIDSSDLLIPDQDIIDHAITDDLLFCIDSFPVLTSDLSLPDSWIYQQQVKSTDDITSDIAMFKFTGSYKPWHLDVLNTDKLIFLHRVKEVSKILGVNLWSSRHCIQWWSYNNIALSADLGLDHIIDSCPRMLRESFLWHDRLIRDILE